MCPEKLKLTLLGDIGHVNIQRWCEALAGAGVDLTVVSFAKSPAGDWTAYQIPSVRGAGKLNYFLAAPHVKRLLAQVTPDVVAAYYVTGYGTLGSLTGFHPLVQVTSGSDVLAAHKKLWTYYVARHNLLRSDLVTAWAPHMADAVCRMGVTENRLLVLPRGIPVQRFASVRCPVPTPSEEIRLVCTRSFKPIHRISILIQAIAELKNAGLNIHLSLAGNGPQRQDLMLLARRLDLEQQIQFVGFVPNDDLPSFLAEHQIYVALTESDGVSASLLEAMAVGLLPIVPDHPANHYWISAGENGVLFGDVTPVAVAECIHQAISDLALRTSARDNNPRIVCDRADAVANSRVFVERFQDIGAYSATLR